MVFNSDVRAIWRSVFVGLCVWIMIRWCRKGLHYAIPSNSF